MAIVTANSTDTLIQNFATRSYGQLHSGINNIGSRMAGTASAATQFASTGTLDGQVISNKTATSFVATENRTEDNDDGVTTVKSVTTISGKSLNVSNANQTWTGIKSVDTWSSTNGASGTGSTGQTLSYQPANSSSQFILSKYSESGTENWTEEDGSAAKVKEGRDFAGALTILNPEEGSFSAKITSLSNTFNKTLNGTQVETFKVTSKTGVTLADGAATGTFDTVNFTYKTTYSTGSTETPLKDSYVVSKADAGVSTVLKNIMLGTYGTTSEEESDWVEFSDADLLSIGQALFSGDDTITGTANADTLRGYAGKDKVTGGKGADVFVFATGDSGITATTLDTVADFKTSEGDKIKLTGLSTKAYDEGSVAVKDFAAAKTAAETLMATGKNVVFEFDKKGGYLFVDSNGDHLADMAIALTGVKAAAGFGEADVLIA